MHTITHILWWFMKLPISSRTLNLIEFHIKRSQIKNALKKAFFSKHLIRNLIGYLIKKNYILVFYWIWSAFNVREKLTDLTQILMGQIVYYLIKCSLFYLFNPKIEWFNYKLSIPSFKIHKFFFFHKQALLIRKMLC